MFLVSEKAALYVSVIFMPSQFSKPRKDWEGRVCAVLWRPNVLTFLTFSHPNDGPGPMPFAGSEIPHELCGCHF